MKQLVERREACDELHTEYDYDSKFCVWALGYSRCFVHDIYLGAVFIITGMLFDLLMAWSLGNLILFRK